MKKIYQIEITETLHTQVEIEADNLEQAIEKGREQYKNEEIILTADDMINEPLIRGYNEDTGEEEYYQEINQ